MHRADSQLTVVQQVLCLECGLRYGKPAAGGTTRENPGCPRCGYVGWIAVRPHGGAEGARRPLRRAG